MEQKTVEQIAAEKYPRHHKERLLNAIMLMLQETFIDGYTHAQQSQPMWREIEAGGEYDYVFVKSTQDSWWYFFGTKKGHEILSQGYTHYLSSEDLLRLPIAQSK